MFFIYSTLFLPISCIEPFEAKTTIFGNTLVIDALLTTENKQHTVKLSRTYRFEDEEPIVEANARVVITDGKGNDYVFQESSPGHYISIDPFGAEEGVAYQLSVHTVEGKSYRSNTVVTPAKAEISDLYVERRTNDLGQDGVSLLLDYNGDGDNPYYFRYEYDETYKIIAPDWDPFEFDVIDDELCADGDGFEVGIRPRTQEQRICYNTNSSLNALQTATDVLEENTLSGFEVRFINKDNYIISHRYSILVRQYSQSPEAYAYYQNLNDFANSESIFSETQPGFLYGNIYAESDKNEKVLGYFEVASLSSERLYFNYSDVFPNEPLPPYAVDCEFQGSPLLYPKGAHCNGLVCDGVCESPLIEAIQAGIVVFNAVNEDPGDLFGPYFTKYSACGDCTKLGSNVVPDFWEN